MLLQLNPSIPVVVTTKDNKPGEAIAWLDYSKEDHVIWGVAMQDTGEVWWVPNTDIRLQNNWSIGRRNGSTNTQ